MVRNETTSDHEWGMGGAGYLQVAAGASCAGGTRAEIR